jgi:transposase
LKPFWKKLRRAQSKIVAVASNMSELQHFANTLRSHADQLINDITCEITIGHLEGFNNKIKTMKRQAYGF